MSVISPFRLAPAFSKSGSTSALPEYAARNSGSALNSGWPCDCPASAPCESSSRIAGVEWIPYCAATISAVYFVSDRALTFAPRSMQQLHLLRIRRRHHQRGRPAGLRRAVWIEAAVEQLLHVAAGTKQHRLGPRLDILRRDARQRLRDNGLARPERVRERHHRPRAALRRQKLIVAVRQAALEVRRAERRRRIEPRRRVPRAVGRLRLQQPVDAALPVRVGDGDAAAVMQRDKRLRRRVRIAHAAVERSPAAVGFLRLLQIARRRGAARRDRRPTTSDPAT